MKSIIVQNFREKSIFVLQFIRTRTYVTQSNFISLFYALSNTIIYRKVSIEFLIEIFLIWF